MLKSRRVALATILTLLLPAGALAASAPRRGPRLESDLFSEETTCRRA